ncbi:hypothetical protein GGS23DRAFT_573477 [Durotheca rogersii]|uniref:uncharacterized protein n=1 Tax=Durotheca rogersii TaxID=419775 RepID=UPI00221F4CD0|nr:uncharacterized protein GGS23DRAFT_573477 [Durotheca rogersii]KAI5862262.1 hypothetical protein GGS23DRAFT_573477 [Durotheca rogersii]
MRLLPLRTAFIGGAALVLVLWCFLLRSERSRPVLASFFSQSTSLDFLDQARRELPLDLSPTIKYSRACIEARLTPLAPRREVANISRPLIADQATLQLDPWKTPSVAIPRCQSIKLQVPEPYPAAEMFPHLIFGLATSYERLRESFESIAHWCSHRDAKLIVIVSNWDERAANISLLQQEYRDGGIRASFIKPLDAAHTVSQSHFMVLTEMVKESGQDTRWFGLLDDDTFFPHLKPLSDALGQLDHTTDLYVGTLAEDFGSIRNFGLMAYGGAGAYLSSTLARKLGAPEQAAVCVRESSVEWGDIIVRDCVYRHSKSRLTILPGLYQQDLEGDTSGFFESGVEPINLHHWKSWYHEPVPRMAVAAKFCGNCFLQRFQFGRDTVLSNGYSIATYRGGLEGVDLDKTEQTWNQRYPDVNPEYTFALGPLREKLGREEKKSYKLAHAQISGDTMRQLYVWRGNREADEADEVVELVWTRV